MHTKWPHSLRKDCPHNTLLPVPSWTCLWKAIPYTASSACNPSNQKWTVHWADKSVQTVPPKLRLLSIHCSCLDIVLMTGLCHIRNKCPLALTGSILPNSKIDLIFPEVSTTGLHCIILTKPTDQGKLMKALWWYPTTLIMAPKTHHHLACLYHTVSASSLLQHWDTHISYSWPNFLGKQ